MSNAEKVCSWKPPSVLILAFVMHIIIKLIFAAATVPFPQATSQLHSLSSPELKHVTTPSFLKAEKAHATTAIAKDTVRTSPLIDIDSHVPTNRYDLPTIDVDNNEAVGSSILEEQEEEDERGIRLALNLDSINADRMNIAADYLDCPGKLTSIQSPSQHHMFHHTTTLPSRTFRKTGTTIVGCIANNGQYVVLAADSRATEGSTVADKQCEKLHFLASNVYCAGAGTSGDIDALVRRVRYTFMLQSVLDEVAVAATTPTTTTTTTTDGVGGGDCDETKKNQNNNEHNEDADDADTTVLVNLKPFSRTAVVSAICRYIRKELFSSGGDIGATLVLGGYEVGYHDTNNNEGRAVLVAIHPHGSMDIVPYTALGSGGIAAMAVLETQYHPSIDLKCAIELVKKAVASGIQNDLGSGSQIDLCVIGRHGFHYQRAVAREENLHVHHHNVVGREKRNERGFSNGIKMPDTNGFGYTHAITSSQNLLIDEVAMEEESRLWKLSTLGIN